MVPGPYCKGSTWSCVASVIPALSVEQVVLWSLVCVFFFFLWHCLGFMHFDLPLQLTCVRHHYATKSVQSCDIASYHTNTTYLLILLMLNFRGNQMFWTCKIHKFTCCARACYIILYIFLYSTICILGKVSYILV